MDQHAMLADVLARPDVWRGDRFAAAPAPALASGFAALDAELPGGGWPRGALCELLVDGSGIGELALVMPALRAVQAQAEWPLLIAPPHPLHAPALAAAGLDLDRLAIVAPVAERDALWAMEQALSGGAAGAVLCWAPADAQAGRRLQVAAAAGAAAAFLFRPLRAARQASAAPLRLALAAGDDGILDVSILKRRGPPRATPLHLQLPRPVRHGSPLAGARPASAAARSPSRPVCV